MQIGWLIAVVVAIAGIALGLHFSPAARLRRRRRKNYSRIVYKSRRPSIRFSVRGKKE